MAEQQTFAAWLEEQLGIRRMAPTTFAREIGASTTAVFNWIAGTTKPKSQVCQKIAAALKVDLIEVLVMAGHLPADALETPLTVRYSPIDWAEALRSEYPDPDVEDLIVMVNAWLDRRRRKREQSGK